MRAAGCIAARIAFTGVPNLTNLFSDSSFRVTLAVILFKKQLQTVLES